MNQTADRVPRDGKQAVQGVVDVFSIASFHCIDKDKDNVYPRAGHEVPEGE